MSHRNDRQGRDMDMGFTQETDYNNGMSFDDMDDGYDTPPDPDADLIDYTKTYTPIAKPDLNIMRTMEDSQILAYPLHSRSLQRKDSVSELPRTPQKSPPQSRLFQSSLPELELHTPGHFNSTNYPTPHLHRDAAQRYFQDNFRNVEVVGKGSFSTVYKATHIQDGRSYAIKISTNKLKGKRQRKKVVDEIKAVASLNNPHVLSYLFAWEQDNTVYIQMELCEKGSLSSFLSEFMAKNPHGKLPEPLIWSYLCDITLGLHYIHRRNLLHLDIKPANIFLSSRNYLVIGDFGQVTNLDESSREAGDSRYMAPETLNFPPTQESDLFSMGATIFEVASLLEMPKGGAYWRVLRGSEPNVDQSQLIYNALGPYSDDLKSVILSLMKNDPNHRITTAQILQLPHIKQVLADRFQRFDFDYRKSIDATLSLNSVSQNISHNGSMSVPSNGRTLSQSSMLFTPQSSYGSGQSSLMADEDFFVSPPEPSSAERHGSAHSDRPGLSFGSKLKRNLAQDFYDDDEADTSGDFL